MQSLDTVNEPVHDDFMDIDQSILDATLALPYEERAALAHRLLESLDPPGRYRDEFELAAELERRIEDVEGGGVKTIPWTKVRKEVFRQSRRFRAGR